MAIGKKVTRVEIWHDDGTMIRLADPEGCKAWQDMVETQAGVTSAHGINFGPLPWEEVPSRCSCQDGSCQIHTS